MSYRTELQRANDAGWHEACAEERGDCPRCLDADTWEDEECCQECRDELASWAAEDARADRYTRGAEGGWSDLGPFPNYRD